MYLKKKLMKAAAVCSYVFTGLWMIAAACKLIYTVCTICFYYVNQWICDHRYLSKNDSGSDGKRRADKISDLPAVKHPVSARVCAESDRVFPQAGRSDSGSA